MKQSVASTEYDQSEKKWQSTNSDGMDIGNVGGSNVQSIAHIALGLTTLGSRVLIQDICGFSENRLKFGKPWTGSEGER